MKIPDITVLISTYDDRALIDKKLREVRAQTLFDRAEFIFIEPASPGRERELLEPFCQEHGNCLLIALEERVSLYRAWNLGWERASAPIISISNMDDSMHPHLLETIAAEMHRKSYDLVTVLIAKQMHAGKELQWDVSQLSQLKLITRPGPFFAWRSSIRETFGVFDEDLKITGDKDFWARAVYKRLRFGIIPKVLYVYNAHQGQLSKSQEAGMMKTRERRLCKRKPFQHQWPVSLVLGVRGYRILRKFPFIGRLFYTPIPHNAGASK